ncbi:MAG: HDOD domain-containing protein [Planctomycetes bacterium]|nr:HDOD domain-containing protein [Planctomycetota bacterium]
MNQTTIDKLARQERIRREILNKSDLIPTLPDLVVRVIELLNRGTTEPEELERHIQYDQVLVAKLLGMVNSPFYAVNRKITTVSDAVMVLGFRGLRSLVLASSTAQFMTRDFSLYGHTDKGLWLHALTTATIARTLGRECRLGAAAAEELFIAGLLHDVGKMLVAPHLMEIGAPRMQPTDDVRARERDAIGIDHEEAGALVCAKWNLSQELQSIIVSLDDEDTDPPSKDVAVVRIADQFACELGHGFEPGLAPLPHYRASDFEVLGLNDKAWEEARERIELNVEAAMSSLRDICG